MQVLFLQSHSTCFGRQAPIIRSIKKTGTVAPGTGVIVPGRSSHHHIRGETNFAPSFLILPMMGAWRPKHVEWLCRKKTCTVLHQVGVLFDLCNSYCFSTATLVQRAILSVKLYVHCLSCFSFTTFIFPPVLSPLGPCRPRRPHHSPLYLYTHCHYNLPLIL